jgi:hypothetical protein
VVTALGQNPITVCIDSESVVFPLRRSLAIEPSALRSALAESPRTKLTRAGAWPLVVAAVSIGFVGAHYGKPSHLANGLAVLCLIVRFLPNLRARAATGGQGILEHVTLGNESIVIEREGDATAYPWEKVSFYLSKAGAVIALEGRASPCLLGQKHFTPAEYTALLELLAARAKRVGKLSDLLMLSALVLFLIWVAWRTWYPVA